MRSARAEIKNGFCTVCLALRVASKKDVKPVIEGKALVLIISKIFQK
jgi:hypothetical protein